MACSNHWTSPFQVGSHHLAREFIRDGWQVAYVSDPLSPWHVFSASPLGWMAERRRIHQSRGKWERDSKLWHYVPYSLIVPHNKPILRNRWVHHRWHEWTIPNPVHLAASEGFARVDLLYIDSFSQAFWLDAIEHDRSVYRITDLSNQRPKYCSAAREIEEKIASTVDVVVVPSRKLQEYARSLGARQVAYLPNGIDFHHFSKSRPVPEKYAKLPRPIAVYMGVMPDWFDDDLIRRAATILREMTFVLLGPRKCGGPRFRFVPNVYELGVVEYERLPAYLQHADVGLLPFNVRHFPHIIDSLHPQKLYAYLASGLPVVATRWSELQNIDSPAILSDNHMQFISNIKSSSRRWQPSEYFRSFARKADWGGRLQTLLKILQIESRGKPSSNVRATALSVSDSPAVI